MFFTKTEIKRKKHHRALKERIQQQKEIKRTLVLIICSFWCYLLYVHVNHSKSSDRLVNKLQTPDCGLVIRCLWAHFPISIFYGGLVVSFLILLCKNDHQKDYNSYKYSTFIWSTVLAIVVVYIDLSTYGWILKGDVGLTQTERWDLFTNPFRK